MTDKKRIAGVEVHFGLGDGAKEEHIRLDERPTERALVAAIAPRPTPRAFAPLPAHARPASSPELSDAVAKVGSDMTGIAEYLEASRKHQDRANKVSYLAHALIARELGIEARMPPEIRASLPPAPPTELPAPPPLRTIADQSVEAASNSAAVQRRSGRQLVAELIIAIVTLATAIEHVVNLIGKQ